jgi:hypothetical protein
MLAGGQFGDAADDKADGGFGGVDVWCEFP